MEHGRGCAGQSNRSCPYSSASSSVATSLSFSSVARETAAGSSCCRGDILRDPVCSVAGRQKAEQVGTDPRSFSGGCSASLRYRAIATLVPWCPLTSCSEVTDGVPDGDGAKFEELFLNQCLSCQFVEMIYCENVLLPGNSGAVVYCGGVNFVKVF